MSQDGRCAHCGEFLVVPDRTGRGGSCVGCGHEGPGGRAGFSPPRVGPLEVRRHLGQGAFGQVYLCQHEYLGIPVAMKILRRMGDVERNMLLREARLGVQANHPSVVRIFDCGEHAFGRDAARSAYVVMEYVEGPDLSHLLETRKLPRGQAFNLAAQVAEGLGELGRLGLAHRDVKPANILVSADRAKVADLGCAIPIRPEHFDPRSLFGTLPYIAPELFSGQNQATTTTDLYALMVTLYEMIAGHHRWPHPLVHEGRRLGIPEYIERKCSEPPVSIARLAPDLDSDIADWIDRSLALDYSGRPEEDPVDVAALLRRFASILGDRPGPTYRFHPMGSVLRPSSGTVVLDVGNAWVRGIIDHHHRRIEGLGSASLMVLAKPQYVTEHVQGAPQVSIETHLDPDLDAAYATYLARYLMEGKPITRKVRRLADWVDQIDRGLFPDPGDPAASPYAIYQGIVARVRETCRQRGILDPQEISRRILLRGHALCEFLLLRMQDGCRLGIDPFFEVPTPFEEERRLMAKDRQSYLEDLRRATFHQVRIPRRPAPGEFDTTYLVCVSEPASSMFKLWARLDTERTPDGRGFGMTCVHFTTRRRSVIATDPGRDFWLVGLGDALETLEEQARSRVKKPRPPGLARPGYGSPDPWYDGRNTAHDHTIVDAPRSGTVLDPTTVTEAVLRYASAHPFVPGR